jgi:hypothetical protein
MVFSCNALLVPHNIILWNDSNKHFGVRVLAQIGVLPTIIWLIFLQTFIICFYDMLIVKKQIKTEKV